MIKRFVNFVRNAEGGAGGGATAAGDQPAGAAPAGGAATGGEAPASANPSWYEGLTPEQIGIAQNAKWTKPQEVMQAYEGMLKLRGVPETELIRVPKADDAKAWDGVYNRLGRPETPDKYQFEIGKDVPVDQNLLGAFKTWAHGEGMSNKQAQGFLNKWNEYVAQHNTNFLKDLQIKSAAEMEDLKKEWGAAYDEQRSLGERAARAYGLSKEDVEGIESVIGTKKMMQFLAQVGKGQAEPSAHGLGGEGGGAPFAMTSEQARAEIERIKRDPTEGPAYIKGDTKIRERMDRLFKIAFPDQK